MSVNQSELVSLEVKLNIKYAKFYHVYQSVLESRLMISILEAALFN